MTQNSPLSTSTTVYLLFPSSNHQLVCMKSASAPPQRGESLRLRSEHPADVLHHCHSRFPDILITNTNGSMISAAAVYV